MTKQRKHVNRLRGMASLARWDQEQVEPIETLLTRLEDEGDQLLEERRQHVLTSCAGKAELILCAIAHLEVKFNKGTCEGSNLPQSIP